MPLIHIELFEGRTQEQKKDLAQAITRETSRIFACSEESVDIIYTDLKRENWATGGKFWSER
jgi:4-oxalocrotonate tautomerase